MTDQRMPVADVVVRDDLYPRMAHDPALVQRYADSLELLPPIWVNQHNELIDGKHRWLAHRAAGAADIAHEVVQTSGDADLLMRACRANASHGYQLTQSDKQRMARQIYNAWSDVDRKGRRGELAETLAVPERTIRSWVNKIDKDAAAERRERAYALWLACHTQQDIADALEMPQRTIADLVKDFSEIGNLAKSAKIAAEFGDWESPPLYTLWQWRDKSNDTGHPGNSETEIVERLLYMYTQPFETVVDPFAGGGSTIDAGRKRSRRYWVSDLTPIVERETEIRQHDICGGIPVGPRWGDVQLVYLDPPYWRQAEGWYGDSPANLANMELDAFHNALAGVINGFAGKLKPGAKIALLMQPTQWKASERAFTDHTAEMLRRIKLPVVQRIQCPYTTQQATPQMVDWAKAKHGNHPKADWIEVGERGWARYVHIPTDMERAVVAGVGQVYRPQAGRASPTSNRSVGFDRVDVPLNIKQIFCVAQGYRCAGCVHQFGDVRHFEIDHVVSLANNGRDELRNWQLLCPPCNRRKGARNGKEGRHPNEWLWQRNFEDVFEGKRLLLDDSDFTTARRIADAAALCYRNLPDMG